MLLADAAEVHAVPRVSWPLVSSTSDPMEPNARRML